MNHEAIVLLVVICTDHPDVAERIKTETMGKNFVIHIETTHGGYYSGSIPDKYWPYFSFLKTATIYKMVPEHPSKPEELLFPLADTHVNKSFKQGIYKEN